MKKVLNLVLIICTCIYSLWYASLGGYVGNEGALSTIGLSHRLLFIIWGILTYITLALNIHIGFKETKYKFYIPLLMISFIGMSLTLICRFKYSLHTEYLLHCIGSLTFSAITGVTVLLLFIVRKKYILAVICGSILISDLSLLLIYKETALIELFPIFAGYILLSILNFRRERDLIEVN